MRRKTAATRRTTPLGVGVKLGVKNGAPGHGGESWIARKPTGRSRAPAASLFEPEFEVPGESRGREVGDR